MNHQQRWKPNVTVATLVERNERFLLVEEHIKGQAVLNQPAGHLDEHESLIEAARRETLEETAWDVEITGFMGCYRYIAPNGITYLRHGFVAKPLQHFPEQTLDEPIIQTHWMSLDEIMENKERLRSPMVLELIDHYIHGLIYPLTMFHEPK